MSGPELILMTEYLDSWDSKKLNGSIDILGNDEKATKELLNWLIDKKNHVIRKYKITKSYFEAEDWKIIKEPFGEYPNHSLQYQIQTLAKDLKGILSGLSDKNNFTRFEQSDNKFKYKDQRRTSS